MSKTRSLVTAAFLAAVLVASKFALDGLPNIELVSLLVILYTLEYPRLAVPAVYTYVFVYGLLNGFGIWWFPQLYIWAVLMLFARLMRCLAPGGVLAVQMPDNLDQPSHQLMRELANQSAWRDQLARAADQRAALLSVEAYYDLLAPMACRVDIWHTAYRHVMPSVQAIVEWLESTGLKPFLDPLPAVLRDAYLQAYTQRIGEAYTERADGHRLFAFPRLFIVAQRAP